MKAVPQFGRALLIHLGAPAGRISTFTELRFVDEDEKLSIPDGGIVVEWGRKRWVCLLEVKTSGADLRADQVSRYLDLARANNFDAVLTISNEITSSPAVSPVDIDARRLRKVTLRHLSWWRVMTEARVQHKHRGIADPDQAWILGELIAYLDHERAGAGGFEDMGDKWVGVREGARAKSLRTSDAGVREIATRWEQFVQYVSLGLTQDLGRPVEPMWPKRLELAQRRDAWIHSLVDDGKLSAALRVPDAVAPIEIEADLRSRLFITQVEVAAPREGKAKTRIAWLVRQLKNAPKGVRVEARYANARDGVSQLLADVVDKPERLLLPTDLRREPRAFRVSLSEELGAKRGRGAGSFVHESKSQTSDFYRGVVQQLRAWSAPAPKLPGVESASPEATSEPPPFSSPSGREFGEATLPDG